MIRRVGAALAVVAACAGTAFAASGCGSSSSSSSGGGASSSGSTSTAASSAGGNMPEANLTGISAEGGAAQALATTAGQTAARAAGPQVALPANKTVGFLQIVGGIQSADRVANAAKKALDQAGYKLIFCDGAGDPAKQVTCANTLLGAGVSAILTTGVDPSVVAAPLREARAKGIPWIDTAGKAPPGYTAQYAPDDTMLGATLGNYIINKLNALPGGTQELATSDFPIPSIADRLVEFKRLLQNQPKIKIVASVTADAANLIAGTRQQVSTTLTAHPNIKAFYFGFDTAGQAGGQQVAQMFPGKQFPAKPMVATFHADPGTVDLIRSGSIDVIADVAYDVSCWVAVDQLLEHFARNKPFSQSLDPRYPGAPDLYSYTIVTKANLPTTQYLNPTFDVVSFFESKWRTEFRH